jgi:putative endonuclease
MHTAVENRRDYHVYIVTNPERNVLYTGVTNNLAQRLIEHWMNKGKTQTFAGKYYCYNLIYYETFKYVNTAISREKEIKGWKREKKLALIKTMNPDWVFLNVECCSCWPPQDYGSRL